MKPLFRRTARIHADREGRSKEHCKNVESKLNWQWYNPPEDSLPVAYCLDTSLHGLRHIAERERHICERLFWLITFIVSVITAVFLIWRMWTDYNNMPVVTVMNPAEINLNEIPFPSVTICNVNKIRKSTYENLYLRLRHKIRKSQRNNTSSEDYLKPSAIMLDLLTLCDAAFTFMGRIPKSVEETIKRILGHLAAIAFDVGDTVGVEDYINPRETLRNVSQARNHMLLECSWQGKFKPCSDYFQSVLTDHGYCCRFNGMPTSQLLTNSDFGGNISEHVNRGTEGLDYETLLLMGNNKGLKFPERQKTAGRLSGLSILLDPDLNEYSCPSTDSLGFTMGINVPLDFPRLREDFTAITINSEVFIGVRPEITMSDKSISGFSLKKRRCYYGNEMKLAYYSIYTISNCRSECITRNILLNCGCVLYYMPGRPDDAPCRPYEYNCTHAVQEQINKAGLTTVCSECLPTCTEIHYHPQVTSLPLLTNKANATIVHVYLNTNSVYPRLRKVSATIPELLSNTGGLLGLCLGFSVVSLLEMFYYGTLRPIFRWYKNKIFGDLTTNSGMTWAKTSSATSKRRRSLQRSNLSSCVKRVRAKWRFPRIWQQKNRDIHDVC